MSPDPQLSVAPHFATLASTVCKTRCNFFLGLCVKQGIPNLGVDRNARVWL